MIIKRKLYSISRLGAGLRGAAKSLKYAVPSMIAGGVLAFIPALIARIFGKKAFLITEALGAGLGLGLLVYLGYKEGISEFDYDKKLKSDPEFKKKEEEKDKKELESYLSSKDNYLIPSATSIISTLHKVEKRYNISYKKDLYSYIKYYESFYKKYYKLWYNVLARDAKSLYDCDIEFEYIFPEPVFDYDQLCSEIEDTKDFEMVSMVAGSLGCSDHGYLFYHFNDDNYSFDLGSGYDSKSIADTIIKRCKDFRDFYNKSKTEQSYLNIVKTHTEIIDKFIEGLKRL